MNRELVCEDCKTTEDVSKTVNPYEEEIEVILCIDCYANRWLDT